MLFTRPDLERIADGSVTLAFRRWRRPTVRAGGRLTTPVGVLAIDAVDRVAAGEITDDDARRAGFTTRDAVLAELDRRAGGDLHRIAFHLAGPDPRVALRAQAELDDAALDDLRRRLARLDAASRRGPWTVGVLELLDRRPAVRAADLLADSARDDLPAFKADVRKLKRLGLTISLERGYRLSPRGEALLARLREPAPHE